MGCGTSQLIVNDEHSFRDNLALNKGDTWRVGNYLLDIVDNGIIRCHKYSDTKIFTIFFMAIEMARLN